MDVASQIRRIPGLRQAVHLARTATLRPGGDAHSQWARIVMNRETDRLIRSLDLAHSSVLEISGQKWRSHGFCRYQSVEFPTYDVCSHVLDDQFDIIIAEQVFEHLLWPYRAVRNVFQMLTPNGALLITTPFLIKDSQSSGGLLAMDGNRNSTSSGRRWVRYQSHHDRIMG